MPVRVKKESFRASAWHTQLEILPHRDVPEESTALNESKRE